ncbi:MULTISPECIES: YciI family protein [unclassified Neorhizobium]|uniref:YciI family protein n=1 Tax=unclassified Neorhizobium TaxID=2629175 RepID=UPI001FF320B3|nr:MULTISPECIES: YciI family protein [unclassified Neorhizobium]MCJ9672472.1 YciI family protein [Neorhizobium sp. SHOUNA12B]MCJ9745082.1 YciI family protein [Neorhizobium sp. SHOUNA12A]
MPKFITIGYGDPAGYDRTPGPVKDVAHAQDAKLRSEGAVIGIAGTPVQVRNPEARGVETRDGPFMSSALQIAGFAVIEATDLADAIEKVSHVPCAVAHGVVEVWPLKEVP